VRAPLEPRGGTIAGFAIELLVRIILFALLYAFAAVAAVIAMALASRAILAIAAAAQKSIPLLAVGLDILVFGMLALSVMAGALAGVVAAIGSVLTASFRLVLLLSLAATIAPVIFFLSLGSLDTDTVLYFLAGGLLSGLLGVYMAQGCGLLQPDRRLIQDVWR
jgi:hypothetical protein